MPESNKNHLQKLSHGIPFHRFSSGILCASTVSAAQQCCHAAVKSISILYTYRHAYGLLHAATPSKPFPDYIVPPQAPDALAHVCLRCKFQLCCSPPNRQFPYTGGMNTERHETNLTWTTIGSKRCSIYCSACPRAFRVVPTASVLTTITGRPCESTPSWNSMPLNSSGSKASAMWVSLS